MTCPTTRIHPAILAQATATVGNLLDGRFTWGVGTGEALNEHILGDRWPPAPVRREQLVEALDVIRELWSGDTVDHRGEHFCVEDARLFDPPEHEIPIIVSAFGPDAAEVAARVGDGLWTSAAEIGRVVARRRRCGTGVLAGQPVLGRRRRQGRRDRPPDLAEHGGAGPAEPGSPDARLTSNRRPRSSRRRWSPKRHRAGRTPTPIVAKANGLIEAGVDHVYFHQIGPDQEGFCEFWKSELEPVLRAA